MQRSRRERYDSVGDSVKKQAKRKRELLGEDSFKGREEEIFQKSKKMIRSPVKGGGKEGMIGGLKELT